MTFISSALAFSLVAVSLAQWCEMLSADHLRSVREDLTMRNLGHETLFAARDIERQNLALKVIEASCIAAALPAPSLIQNARQMGAAIARAQDLRWGLLRSRLLAAQHKARVDLSDTLRGTAGICSPGTLSWKSPSLLVLRSLDAGIEVRRDTRGSFFWRFSNPDVRRRLR